VRKSLYFPGILNDSDTGWLVAAGSRREIAAGSKLIEEGRPIDAACLIIDGAFKVGTAALGNREEARLMSGEVVGEMSFVDQAPPSATVQALEPSLVLEIPWRRLNAKLAEDPGFTARFCRALSMFLAARLRALDKIAMAGARFDWIQRRLRPE
jgi:CRP-like cAMP-binding protein